MCTYLLACARTNLKSIYSLFEQFEHCDDSDNSTQMYVYLTPTITSQVNLSLIQKRQFDNQTRVDKTTLVDCNVCSQ